MTNSFSMCAMRMWIKRNGIKINYGAFSTLMVSPSMTSGSIFGDPIYQTLTFGASPFIDIEMSKGCDKSIFSFLELLYCIVVIKIN